MQPFNTPPGLMIIKERYSRQIRESVPLWWPICLFSSDPDPYVSNICREDTDHLPRKAMGEKDLMTDDETLGSERIRRICPSKTAPLMIDMDTFILHALFRWFDSSV